MEGLNKQQYEAVTYNDGPLLILAGAGSGKTRVLTEKIVYLVENKIIAPSNILAITFTNKAANEMRNRIGSQVGHLIYEMQVSTFHALGLRIIREQYANLGLNKQFTVIDSDDSLTVIKKILKEKNLDPKQYSPYYIKEQISSAKNNLIDAKHYENLAKLSADQVVATVYNQYEKILRKNHSLDFDDLLGMTYKLLKNNPELLAQYQERYQYILVDEYQDTNQVQYALVKILSKGHQRICVVGDSDQSIYSWRGANYQNILNFEHDFPNAKVVLLEQNYRSTKNILKSANNLIKYNQSRHDKKLWSDLADGDPIEYYHCNDEREEGHKIVSLIKDLDNVNLNDICILYRTNAQSRIIEEMLLKSNLPYRIVGSYQFYARKEIKDLLAYLKLINNPYDDLSLLRIINEPKRGIGNKTIENLEIKALSEGKSIFDVISDKKELTFKKLILRLQEIASEVSLTELIDQIIKLTGIEEIYKNGSLEENIRLENINEFKSITENFEQESGSVTLSDFLMDISLLTDAPKNNQDQDAITLMTMHAVKGLEYDYVFIAGMEESIFPHFRSLDDAEALEEERRLCYVAITRAKKKCYLFSTGQRLLFGQFKSNLPSRFIKEIGDLEVKSEPMKIKHTKQNYYVAEGEKTVYKVGDNIMHKLYGKGKIIEIKNDIGTIIFGKEIKKIIVNHQFVSKIEVKK